MNDTILGSSPEILDNKSPLPQEEPEELTFPQAMEAVIAGKRVTRKLWKSSEEYALFKDGWLTIHTRGNDHTWNINDGDLFGKDWIVLAEGN